MSAAVCKYCLRPIDSRGMNAHVHFKHRSYVAREFMLNPHVWAFLWATDTDPCWLPTHYIPDVTTKALPSSTANAGPIQPMLTPVSKALRWI